MSFSSDELQQYPVRLAELPQGWMVSDIAALATNIQPGFPSGKHNQDGQGVPHLRPMNVSRDGSIDLTDLKYVLDQDGPRLNDGDVLFNNTNSPALVGKTAVVRRPSDWAFSNHMTRITPARGVVPSYLAHHLHYLWMTGYLRHRCVNHVNQASISSGPLASVPIAVPPSAEQERIVAAIEEQFSRLDAGVAALDAAFVKAGTLAKAAMEAAVSSWDQVPLREVLSSLRNGIFVSRPGTAPTRRAILRISAVRPLRLDAAEVRYVPESTTLGNEDAFRIDAGDLLFTRYNGNADLVGACALVGAEAAGMLYPDKLIRAVVNKGRAMPDYLEIALNCGPSLRAIAERRKTTAGQVGISGSQLLSVPVPLPPLADQERMVAQTRSVLDAVRRLRLETARARRRCEGLRSAVLAAAFSGKLVPQNPDDEPVPVLLERIAAERASANGHKTANVRKPRTTRPKVSA